MKVSRLLLMVSIAPSLLMLTLFYSLAVHLHQSLGDWPEGIGESGFSRALLIHANISTGYFWVLLLVNILAVPIGLIVAVVKPQWKRFRICFATHVDAYLICWVSILLAPKQLLYWWWD